jgi:hypothetical protein
MTKFSVRIAVRPFQILNTSMYPWTPAKLYRYMNLLECFTGLDIRSLNIGCYFTYLLNWYTAILNHSDNNVRKNACLIPSISDISIHLRACSSIISQFLEQQILRWNSRLLPPCFLSHFTACFIIVNRLYQILSPLRPYICSVIPFLDFPADVYPLKRRPQVCVGSLLLSLLCIRLNYNITYLLRLLFKYKKIYSYFLVPVFVCLSVKRMPTTNAEILI